MRWTRFKGRQVPDNRMVDNQDEQTQLRASPEDSERGHEEGAMVEVERSSYAVRVRMIIMLSLLCWAVLIAALAWAFA